MLVKMETGASSGGGGIGSTVVSGNVSISGANTTPATITVSGLSEIDYIAMSLNSAPSVNTTDANFVKISANYTVEKMSDTICYKTGNSTNPEYGPQSMSGNTVTFTHWNNTAQTVYYYAVGK